MSKWLIASLLTLLIANPVAAEPAAWATYTVTFDATWSAETHPAGFPPSPHFSGLIGGTHNAAIRFWAEGDLASLGVKQMAEWGSQPAHQAEVEAEIMAGNAGQVIVGDVLWVSPGQIETSFTITPDHPLVSLTTMIAPSPDWFTGVESLNLVVADQWVTELVVPLYPFDAGTDSGVNYTSGDVATNPAVAIAAITDGLFTPGVPVGTLTFRRDAASAVPVLSTALSLSAQPNPFNPATVLHYVVPADAHQVRLAIFDLRGQLVRRLATGQGAGPQATTWNGRTDNGVAAASGVYFARLEVDGAVVVQKMALVQ